MSKLEAFIQLNLTQYIGNIRLKVLLDNFGSVKNIFSASKSELMKVEGIDSRIAEAILGVSKSQLEDELRMITQGKIGVITINQSEYPEDLVNIYSPPILLYVKGKLLEQDRNAVAIVGSRRASYYGLSIAEELAYKLASMGVTIVSGMARGIDTASHRGALKAGGRTIAVLGSGLANIYPPENVKLSERIAKKGAVITEFPMNVAPHKQNFPKRNRIISGLSLGVVVVEAAKRSGSLITADLALEQGREVFAIPGRVKSTTSIGTHNLIKQGAKLVANVEDILEELNLNLSFKENLLEQKNNKQVSILKKEEKKVFSFLTDEPFYLDKLADITNISVSKLSGILLRLQIKGLIKEFPGKRYLKI